MRLGAHVSVQHAHASVRDPVLQNHGAADKKAVSSPGHAIAPSKKSEAVIANIEAVRADAASHGLELRSAALFLAGPRRRVFNLDAGEAARLKAYLDATGIAAVAHGAYVDVPWTGDPKAAVFIAMESRRCALAGLRGLVIHLPNNRTPEQIVKFLARCIHPRGVRIYLEMVAAKRCAFCDTRAIARLFGLIRRRLDPGLRWVGLCVDTAHLWSSGVDLRSRAGAAAWFAGVPRALRAHTIVHLNDSAFPRGDGRDRHASLGAGEIWKHDTGGLAAVCEFLDDHKLIAILERHSPDLLSADFKILKKLSG